MSGVRIGTKDGKTTTVGAEARDHLAAGMRGELLDASSPGYDEARTIWNAMIDRRPALIARCAGAADVVAAVRFAAEHDLLTAVRGGGHNIAGNAVCDGGLMIDLSPMNSVRVDPARRTAWVGPGATLADLDHETLAFGLATPVGINSTTGVAGLTLGGGFGWLSRKHGLTVDNLVSADVVLADGRMVRASEDEHPELFWALRGGGGNFGVVTSFELRLHPVGPDLLCGLIVYPMADARKIFDRYREYVDGAPDELTAWAVLRKAPPLPFVPTEWHGKEVMVLALVWCGAAGAGEPHAAALRGFATPVGEHVGVMPFAAFQQAFDPLLTPGARNYWKSHDFAELSDDAVEVILDSAGKLPSPHCEIFVGSLGGAVSRVAVDATAYSGRDASYVVNVHGRWETAAEDEAGIAWARGFFEAAKPHATGGVYVNFMTGEETDRIKAAYGPNFERLARVKATYDPDNLFRLNQNIAPRA